MRRLLAARGTTVAAAGILALLIAGGGYALASSSGTTIHACVHKSGGDIYIAKKCAKHDNKLSWNQAGPKGATGATGATGSTGGTGPQGPGATALVYNAGGGGASPAPVTLGTIGPWTITATCSNPSAGSTALNETLNGSGGQADGILVAGTMTESLSMPFIANVSFIPVSSASSTPVSEAVTALFVPTSGPAVQLTATAVATGSTTNSCHFSVSSTPISSVSAHSRRIATRSISPAPGAGVLGTKIG